MFEVRKGLEMPLSRSGARKKYPFSEMECGDSFFIPCEEENRSKVRHAVATSAYKLAQENGGKFSTREEDNGVSVWKIK